MKKYFFIVISLLFLTLALTLGWLITPENLRSFVYRELSYLVMSHHLAAGERTELGKVEKLFQFIHDTLHIPPGYPAIDKTVLNDLVRGIGWCDQQSWALVHLADKAGVRGSLVMLKGKWEDSGHTVARLFLEGEYRIFDPLYGVIFRNEKNKVATFDDFQRGGKNGPERLRSEKFERLLKHDPALKEKYFGFFDKKYPPTVWSDLSEGRPLLKRGILSILKLSYNIFGDAYARLFQDLYLRNETPFYKARHDQLYFRYEEAEKEYKRALLIEDDSRKDEIYYHLGTLYYHSGQHERSEQVLNTLLVHYPKTAWSVPAHHYLELLYERAGKRELAYRHFLHELKKYQ